MIDTITSMGITMAPRDDHDSKLAETLKRRRTVEGEINRGPCRIGKGKESAILDVVATAEANSNSLGCAMATRKSRGNKKDLKWNLTTRAGGTRIVSATAN